MKCQYVHPSACICIITIVCQKTRSFSCTDGSGSVTGHLYTLDYFICYYSHVNYQNIVAIVSNYSGPLIMQPQTV